MLQLFIVNPSQSYECHLPPTINEYMPKYLMKNNSDG